MSSTTHTLQQPVNRHFFSSVVTLSLWLAFVALVAICVVALWIIASVTLRLSMSQTLRLNED